MIRFVWTIREEITVRLGKDIPLSNLIEIYDNYTLGVSGVELMLNQLANDP